MSELNYLNLYTTDPAVNLASEQYVFDSCPKDRSYLMLWQNDNAVIIGKYQNTYAEINDSAIEKYKTKVVRRLSGGGAVYHDLGNLNYTFIADAGDMDNLNLKVFCEPIVDALKGLGIAAEVNGRNDITIDGRKFSGNSQYVRGGRVMHHGTIMFCSDLDIVQEVLNVDKKKIESKGMKSVRSRVTNISEHLEGDIKIDEFREMLLNSILGKNRGKEFVFQEKDLAGIEKIADGRYRTWEWNYGKSPECTMHKKARTEGCGTVEIFIGADKGIIDSVEFKGDFFSFEEPEKLAEYFIGHHADAQGFREVLSSVNAGKYFAGMTNERLLDILLSE